MTQTFKAMEAEWHKYISECGIEKRKAAGLQKMRLVLSGITEQWIRSLFARARESMSVDSLALLHEQRMMVLKRDHMIGACAMSRFVGVTYWKDRFLKSWKSAHRLHVFSKKQQANASHQQAALRLISQHLKRLKDEFLLTVWTRLRDYTYIILRKKAHVWERKLHALDRLAGANAAQSKIYHRRLLQTMLTRAIYDRPNQLLERALLKQKIQSLRSIGSSIRGFSRSATHHCIYTWHENLKVSEHEELREFAQDRYTKMARRVGALEATSISPVGGNDRAYESQRRPYFSIRRVV